MPTAPVQESPSARQAEDGSAVAASGPGGSESLAHTTGASVTATEAMTENVRTSGGEAAVAGDALETNEALLTTVEEQIVLPLETPGMVEPAVRPQSPPMVPEAVVEEDEIDVIERAEPQPQSVRIIRKRGEEVVVVEEENTTREIKRLKSAVAGVMTEIEVSTASEILIYVVGDQSLSLALFIHRG